MAHNYKPCSLNFLSLFITTLIFNFLSVQANDTISLSSLPRDTKKEIKGKTKQLIKELDVDYKEDINVLLIIDSTGCVNECEIENSSIANPTILSKIVNITKDWYFSSLVGKFPLITVRHRIHIHGTKRKNKNKEGISESEKLSNIRDVLKIISIVSSTIISVIVVTTVVNR